MNIRARALKPTLTVEDVDVYLPRGVAALRSEGKNPRGLFRIFQRHEGARFFGRQEYLTALASLMTAEEVSQTIVYSVPEGYALKRHETAMTIEGPATALMVNETLLHYLSTATRFRTLAGAYPARKYPWVFMGARYLASDDLALATRALSEEGILSTVPRWADKFIGTESHSQIAIWAGLVLDDVTEAVITEETSNEMVAATIRATVAFHRANPDVPLYVLGDFAARSVGCYEVFRATAAVCARLGIPLLGGRMDISKADLDDDPIIDKGLREGYEFLQERNALSVGSELAQTFYGMSPKVVSRVRHLLSEAGLLDFKIVVSSGIKLGDIGNYLAAGASIVGIGEEAAYYLNKGECNFTSDAVGYFQDGRLVPFAKEGRELHYLLDERMLANATMGLKLSVALERIELDSYL